MAVVIKENEGHVPRKQIHIIVWAKRATWSTKIAKIYKRAGKPETAACPNADSGAEESEATMSVVDVSPVDSSTLPRRPALILRK
jgi:hypothetical protein